MAELKLTVGPITSSVTTSDARAAEILSLFVEATNGPADGTNQAKADHVVRVLRDRLVLLARRQRIEEVEEAAVSSEQAAIDAIGW